MLVEELFPSGYILYGFLNHSVSMVGVNMRFCVYDIHFSIVCDKF